MARRGTRLDDDEYIILAHDALAPTRGTQADFEASLWHARRVLSLHDPVRHRGLADLVGQEIASRAAALAATALSMLALTDQARFALAASIEFAERAEHPYSLALAHGVAAFQHLSVLDFEATRRSADEQIRVAEQHGFRLFEGTGLIARALTREEGGAFFADLMRGVALLDSVPERGAPGGSLLLMMVAASMLWRGHRGLAEQQIAQAFELAAKSHERSPLPGLHMLTAELADDDEAREASLQRALEIARELRSLNQELASSLALARHWHAKGRSDDALELLAPVHAQIHEGLDTPTMQEASALLAELTAPD